MIHRMRGSKGILCTVLLGGVVIAGGASAGSGVGVSPWGPKDEIGRLNMMTNESRAAILSRITGGKIYDLGTEYFVGMPSWQAAGDPPYMMWMTHTPPGDVISDPMHVGKKMNEHVSYSGTAVSMYAHMGTHIDALVHFGLDGKIWNGFSAVDHVGVRGWDVAGAEKLPPIVARGVLIDVAAAKGVDALPGGYRVTRQDLIDALKKEGISLKKGDVALIRTGIMKDFENFQVYMAPPPAPGIEAVKYLIEEAEVMNIGTDNLSFETFPSEIEGNYLPLHTYLLGQHGSEIMEMINMQELSHDHVYEFVFITANLKFRGSDSAPMRPIAIPVK